MNENKQKSTSTQHGVVAALQTWFPVLCEVLMEHHGWTSAFMEARAE